MFRPSRFSEAHSFNMYQYKTETSDKQRWRISLYSGRYDSPLDEQKLLMSVGETYPHFTTSNRWFAVTFIYNETVLS